ncbi:hypothetical protein DVR12_26900 [Chitinophaga silvatica]|uniref:DUF3592 domain-containing protein n=2 Tax=Chitinophaga silvatica TaxID=2282649 RepID=A0A3E1Y2C6_9BACT|nr:hypothetical protein DVR12_26900 [Chitinophaga silvatica]
MMLSKKINELRRYEKFGMVILALMFSTCGFWLGNQRENRLYKNGYWTTGIIIERGWDYRGRLAFNYEFYVDGKKYRNQASGIGIRPDTYRQFIGKSLPVIYNSKDPSENKMMIRPSDFTSYELEIPDSLFWILNCVDK